MSTSNMESCETDCNFNLENVVLSHLKNVGKVSQNGRKQYSGHVDNEEQFNSFLTDLKACGFSFSIRNSLDLTRKYTARICFTSTHGEKDVNIPFLGSPFQILKTIHMDCSQGKNYKKTSISTSYDELLVEDPPVEHPYSKKESILKQLFNEPINPKVSRKPKTSKKIDCPAYMTVKCIRIYEDYSLDSYVRWSSAKTKLMKKLNYDLTQNPKPKSTLRYMIVLSPAEEHNHNVVSTNLIQTIHPKLIEEINSLVKTNICSVKEIKLCLQDYVQRMFEESKLPHPDNENRCYYPTSEVIYYHLRKALSKLNMSSSDIETLEECIKDWKTASPDDYFFFRRHSDETMGGDSTLLFCHQTQWQRNIISQNVNDISLLDAAYKTTKFSIPLYFLYVKTKTGYCIVGTFVIEMESSELISEALSIFSMWNPYWQPKYFMSDLSEDEFSAIEQTFLECTVYVCPYHREQSWLQWLKKTSSVSSEAESLLRDLWQSIAASSTKVEYEVNLNFLYSSEEYQENELVQNYFSRKWLPYAHRWVETFYNRDFLFKLKAYNDFETQNVLKHYHFQRFPMKTLTGIIKSLIEHYLVDAYSAQTNRTHKPVRLETTQSVTEHLSISDSHIDSVTILTSEVVEPDLYLSDDLATIVDQTSITASPDFQFPEEKIDHIEEIPAAIQVENSLTRIQTEMREKLKKLTDMTYLAENSENLSECLNLLNDIEIKMLETQNRSFDRLIILEHKPNLKRGNSLLYSQQYPKIYKIVKLESIN